MTTDRAALRDRAVQIYLLNKGAYADVVDATLDLALEEAAKVADDKTIGANGNDAFDGAWVNACHEIAAAIRALKAGGTSA